MTCSSSPRKWCRRPKDASSLSTPTIRCPTKLSSKQKLCEWCADVETSSSPRQPTDSSAQTVASTCQTSNAVKRLYFLDSDRSARRIRDIVRARLGVTIGVIVSDTFGRPWRRGLTDVAIGVAGIAAVVDLRGTEDALGRVMQVTEVAVADELASAAELVMGKSSGIPVAVVRGADATWFRDSSINEIVRPASEDLFR